MKAPDAKVCVLDDKPRRYQLRNGYNIGDITWKAFKDCASVEGVKPMFTPPSIPSLDRLFQEFRYQHWWDYRKSCRLSKAVPSPCLDRNRTVFDCPELSRCAQIIVKCSTSMYSET